MILISSRARGAAAAECINGPRSYVAVDEGVRACGGRTLSPFFSRKALPTLFPMFAQNSQVKALVLIFYFRKSSNSHGTDKNLPDSQISRDFVKNIFDFLKAI